jgi:hypothetical protein
MCHGQRKTTFSRSFTVLGQNALKANASAGDTYSQHSARR